MPDVDQRILVLGRDGQLASHLRDALPHATFAGRASLDLDDVEGIFDALVERAPACIVNAAAYTAVDGAEAEPAAARRLNVTAVAQVARAAEHLGASLVHVSTDYVFDGTLGRPYRERDATNPLNVYGATKLAGEQAVAALCAKQWTLRTSWLFSDHGNNFVKTMLRLGAERDGITVVGDQRGRPTYAGDLAAVIARLVRAPQAVPSGTYHVAGGVPVSWAEFAEVIFDAAVHAGLLARKTAVRHITTLEYPTPAARPMNAIMDGSHLESYLGSPLCDWHRGLEVVMASFAKRTGGRWPRMGACG